MRTSFFAVAIIMVAATVLSVACGVPGSARVDSQTESAGAVDSRELPDYAYRSPAALRGYQIAVREADLLAQLPCYCGCGQDPQYRSLRDCFLDDQGEFRSHGANCGVCLEEAEDAAQWKGEGLSTREIRARIDGKYEGRGQPTDTPPVAG